MRVTETNFGKNVFYVYLYLYFVPCACPIEGVGFITYTSAIHQRAIKMFWVHFWELLFVGNG